MPDGEMANLYRLSSTKLEEKGDRLVFMISLEWTRKGYLPLINFGHSAGADIVVIAMKDGTIKAVVECKNYAVTSYVADDRFQQDLANLDYFDVLPNVEKWFVISYASCLSASQREILGKHHVQLREMGYEP